jgi:DNA repair ATPase RecN
MSDLTKDVILRISAKNLSTADFKQATAAVNELTAAVDRQVQAASKGIVKEKELTETLAKLGDVSKNLQGFAALIQNLKGLDTQIAAQITKLAEAKAAWEAQKTTNEQAANVTVRMTNRLAGLEKAYKAAETALAGQMQRQTEYTAKLQQNGFDVQNLANAERQLTTVADQAGAVVTKLTQARDNYAKILRLNNEAEKEAARVAKEAEAAEIARVAAIQQVTNALEQQRAAEQAARLAASANRGQGIR